MKLRKLLLGFMLACGFAVAEPSVSYVQTIYPGWLSLVAVGVSDWTANYTVELVYIGSDGNGYRTNVECGGPLCVAAGLDVKFVVYVKVVQK